MGVEELEVAGVPEPGLEGGVGDAQREGVGGEHHDSFGGEAFLGGEGVEIMKTRN